MATVQLPPGGHRRAMHHHHHHVMPSQQNQDGAISNAPAETYAPGQTDAAGEQSPSPPLSCMKPTWDGFLHTTYDALMVLEACLRGNLKHVARRPHDRERTQVIRSGNVFIYEEKSSGIKRWTDGVTWSPSRIMGNFLVYRELSAPFPAGEKKKAKKRKRGGSEEQPIVSQDAYTEEDRKLVGSLVDSYGFKHNGLIKKTINVKQGNRNHHIVSYYALEDVKAGRVLRPHFDHKISHFTVRPELLNYRFKIAIVDPAEDRAQLDPWTTNTSMQTAAHSMNSRPPPFSVYTNGPAFHYQGHALPQMGGQMMTYAPQSMSSYHTSNQQYSVPSGSDTRYLNTGIMNGLPSILRIRDRDRTDSVVDGHMPRVKSEFPEVGVSPEMPEIPVFATTGDTGLAEAPTFLHSMSHPADLYAHHNGQMSYGHMDHSEDWEAQANPDISSTGGQMKRLRMSYPVMQMDGAGLAFDPGSMTEYGHMQNMENMQNVQNMQNFLPQLLEMPNDASGMFSL